METKHLPLPTSTSPSPTQRKKWVLPLLASLMASALLLSTSVFFPSVDGPRALVLLFPFSSTSSSSSSGPGPPLFVESKLRLPSLAAPAPGGVPRLAYLLSGSAGDGEAMKRALRALYHPANRYALHLDLEAPTAERLELAASVLGDPVYAGAGNVRVITKGNLVTYRGPTMVANTLHAAALLLSDGGDWDWFVNLSASDYPLVTQDDLLLALSSIPRHLNFIEHTSDIGWKEYQRARPVIIDPGLYSSQKSDVFWITEKRSLPSAFKLFTGSAWVMLSHQFIEFCLWGWDNLPRAVLMYYANFLSSPEGYFHTVICNAPEFRNTTINHDLHFISWDNPPKQHPHFLTLDDFDRMVSSNAPFARKFSRDDPVLGKIDKELLGRAAGGFVPGGWYDGVTMSASNLHNYSVRNVSELRPRLGAERLRRLLTGLLAEESFDGKHCI